MPSVRPLRPTDHEAVVRMRLDLWPDHSAEWHSGEVRKFLAGELRMPLAVLVAADDADQAVGFAELNIRAYAEGCETDRVAFLEGWYVAPEWRRRGVGTALIRAAEAWARAKGCTEFASDALADNDVSARAHSALGFQEVEVIRCFAKRLD